MHHIVPAYLVEVALWQVVQGVQVSSETCGVRKVIIPYISHDCTVLWCVDRSGQTFVAMMGSAVVADAPYFSHHLSPPYSPVLLASAIMSLTFLVSINCHSPTVSLRCAGTSQWKQVWWWALVINSCSSLFVSHADTKGTPFSTKLSLVSAWCPPSCTVQLRHQPAGPSLPRLASHWQVETVYEVAQPKVNRVCAPAILDLCSIRANENCKDGQCCITK